MVEEHWKVSYKLASIIIIIHHKGIYITIGIEWQLMHNYGMVIHA